MYPYEPPTAAETTTAINRTINGIIADPAKSLTRRDISDLVDLSRSLYFSRLKFREITVEKLIQNKLPISVDGCFKVGRVRSAGGCDIHTVSKIFYACKSVDGQEILVKKNGKGCTCCSSFKAVAETPGTRAADTLDVTGIFGGFDSIHGIAFPHTFSDISVGEKYATTMYSAFLLSFVVGKNTRTVPFYR
jgi:hypothetical protein